MLYDKRKIPITYKKLLGQAYRHVANLEDIEYVKADGYKKGNTPPTDGWKPFVKDTRLSGEDDHYWFRTHFKTPKADKDCYFVLQNTTGRENMWNGDNPQGLLYLNGEMVQGFDTNHIETFLDEDTDYEIVNYFYLGTVPSMLCDFRLAVKSVNSRIEKLYYDIMVAYESALMLEENSDDFVNIMSALSRTCNCIDFREPYSEQYYESIEKALRFIEEELYEKLCTTEGKSVVSCVGHSHIDVEWLWTRLQTREKIQRTAATALTLMDKYPEFKFMMSQPELYMYLREEAPEVYEKVKQRASEGRWEAEGAMFVESDCNLVSGESYVRQILLGKKFFKEEFGVDSKILFLPDVFGYSATLPQIMKKSGIDNFVTCKICGNETNYVPHDSFIWQGIDGSEVLVNFLTAQQYSKVPTPGTVYGGMVNAKWIKGAWNRYKDKDFSKSTLFTFGWGDGGGGPTKEMLENQRRLAKGLPGMPITEMKFLKDMVAEKNKEFYEGCERNQYTPKWVGELYYEHHRATYTTIAKTKRNNRKSEFMMQNVEALSCIDGYFGGEYDAETIRSYWYKVLHNQFHDIIPGSSINEVYALADADYAQIAKYYADTTESKLLRLAKDVKATNGILVYNPLGFERKGTVNIDGETYEIGESIPAFGWKVIEGVKTDNKVKVSGLTAENKFYTLTLDNAGRVVSLFDKENDREVIVKGKAGNEIQIYEDLPYEYDNWEISNYYYHKQTILDTPCRVEPVFDGSRAGFRIDKDYQNSTFTQHIWLYSDNRRIDFDNDIEWRETEQLLKFAFPLDVHFNSATSEIQFGHITRPTHRNTSWDRAKFEVFGHKWVDVAENGYGVALLNDCKYGYSIEEDTIKLTAIKCGKWPNTVDDREHHKFTYSILPHADSFANAGVINEAYCLNQPLMTASVNSNGGNLENEFSFVSCDKENVIVETVKKAEDENGIIVRMYDAFDRRTSAKITIADGFKKAYLCDLLENELEELQFDGKTVTVPVSNFEVVTLKFK